jgi:hypothetical protein
MSGTTLHKLGDKFAGINKPGLDKFMALATRPKRANRTSGF